MTQRLQIKVNIAAEKKIISYGGGIVRYFDKTPTDIVCPHFWELNWAYGCKYGCAYCYLQGTFRGVRDSWYRPLDQVFTTLDNFFQDYKAHPQILNSGELTDSMVYPQQIKKISDKFEEQEKHKLLLLTKSGNTNLFLDKQSIFSFSINAPEVSRRWEQKAPSPEKRVVAASKLSEIGNTVRVRIDPIFPIDNWKDHYEDFVNLLFSKIPEGPERITLGTPRGLQKTLRFTKDRSWLEFFSEKSDDTGWGRKIPFIKRKDIYLFISDKLTELGFSKSRVSICKETQTMWTELGWDFKKCKCNCIW
jgi:spore photoproduct lyase